MDTLDKLGILADAAKYDAACTSSGVTRGPVAGSTGMATPAGCCHSFTADGRCITLLKVLMSNACSFDCAYCVNRCSASRPRATFTPRELAELTLDFYKRNYIEGLFLSSGVLGTADATLERMIECLRILRDELRFEGYVHAKLIPGASPELVDVLGHLADRLSSNIELPSASSLEALCPQKKRADVLAPMAQVEATSRLEGRALPGRRGRARSKAEMPSPALVLSGSAGALAQSSRRPFAPAGQSTQLIVGASPEDDRHVLTLSKALYERYSLKRIFFSAYMPMMDDPLLPDPGTPVPLRREHRLYQADWLMRYYSFEPDELVRQDAPWLDLEVDPKLAWALANIERFPVEVMDAPYELLLRVPGIGVTGAKRIVSARRGTRLGFDELKRLRIVLKRAKHFLVCGGKRHPQARLEPDEIRREAIADARDSSYNRSLRTMEHQPSLF